MPNNKPRYSLTVDGKQRTVEADKFKDNVSTFIQDMPDATIRMKDSNGAEKDVKLNDLSDALYTGYQYVTTDKPIYVNTKAPEPEKPQQPVAPKPQQQAAPKPAVAKQQPTQQPQVTPKPQAPSSEPGLIDKIVGAVNTAIGGQPSDMSLGGMQQGGNLIGSLFQSEKPAQKPAVAQQQPTQPTDGNTEEKKRAIDAAKYQQLMNEQNRKIADYGKEYNETLQGIKNSNPETRTPTLNYEVRVAENAPQEFADKGTVIGKDGKPHKKLVGTSSPEDISQEAYAVSNEFSKKKADEIARTIVSHMPEHISTDDSDNEELRNAYYNKDAVDMIAEAAGAMGMTYHDFFNVYVRPRISNAVSERYRGRKVTAPGLSADLGEVAKQGKSYDERWMNDSERATYDTLLNTFHQDLDKLNKEGEAAFTKQMSQETAENMGIGGREGHAMQVGAGASAERARNYAADPQKAVDDVLNKLYAENGGANGGATEDMDRQAIGNLLYRNMMKYLVDQRVPKSKWGYVLQGFADSDVGELFKALTKTSYERHLDNLANDKYVRNLNGFTGLLAQGGHEATKFLGDAWEYWLGGKAGKAVTGAIRRRAIAGLTADLTARGIAEAEAKNIAIRIANARTKSAAEKAFLHAASGSATLGSAQAISGGLRQGLTPAAGQKKAEIQERRANGETITKEQEDKEIAQANAKAHSVGAVAKSAGGSGLSGAAMGATMGIGSLAGDATSKFLSKYFGDVTSAAGGYLAKLNTNAAAATALGQAEGALTGQQPEGSTGQQFASNLVNFAMLDGMNYAPKVLGGHPIRDFRQWKEYERSMDISEEDQDRMRNLGYGDLMDTVDGLVSDRLRTGSPNAGTELSTQRHAESPQETKVNQGMLNMLADPRIPEELKRKYYAVVTGDTSRQLSPIVASEITQDEDGNTYLVTYNKNGNVVSDRQYRNEQAAKEAQMKIGHEQDENLTEALQQNVFAKDADAVMEEAYNAAAEAYKNGGELNNGQKTLIYLYQNKAQLTKAIQAIASGEPLSDANKKLVNLYNAVQKTLYSMDGNIPRIVNDVEEDNGLGTGGLQKARKGHTEKEAKRIAKETGEEIVHVGGDVWRTMSEDQAVKDYQKRLYDYINDIHEGAGEDVAEPKGLPGRTEQSTDTQEQPSNPEQPTQPEQTTGEGDVAQQRPTQQEAEPGTEQPAQPTDTQQPSQPTNAEQPEQPTQTTQPEGQSQVQTVREQGRQRGLSVESDETQLAQIQEDSDLANKRFNNAFQGNQLGEFRNGLIQAVEDDDEDAIQALFDKYGDRLSTEQKEAAMGLVENGAVQNGIEESITNQTMQYQDARKQELDGISDSTGTITEITLQDGSTVYYKSGDITNQYGGIIVVDGNGDTQQIPVSSIAQVGQPTSAKAILDEDTNNFAQGLQNGYQAMASGASMLPGQETTINVGGQSFHATMETELQDGNIQLRLDDGSPLALTPDQLQQARKAARDANTTQQLAEAEQQRQMKEREDQYNKGVVGYGEGNPDFSAPKTDARTAAELMHEQDKKAGKASKERLSDIQSERDKLNDQIRNAQWEMSRQQRWLELNGDTYSEEERASKQAIIDGYQQQINEWQQRVRKLGEVRNAYMSNEERRQFQSNRRKTMDDVRKNTELGIKNGGLTPTTPQNGGQPQVEVPDAKTLLEKYATQADANAALSEMRDNVMKSYRDGSVNVLSDVRAQLRDYEEGMSDLSNDELQNLYLQQAGARQAEEAAMQQVQKIKNLQGQLSNIYKERNKAALNEMSPRERRATILSGAKTPEELQQKAHEAYDGSELESRLDDTEPETLEEYVSQNMPTNLNWEGTGSGITQKRGLKQELGLSRGIGRNFDSNGINSLLAPKGQGISVDEAAHALWEGRPSQFEGATTQDMRNTLLDLIANSPNARYIKSLTIRNRINEVEGYEQAAEEQEQWLQQQADEEAKARQAAIDTYNDYLDDTAKDAVPSDEVSDYLSGLYADEIAKAKEEADEQEEAWREYEKEKQSLEPNNNNNGTEREDGTGEDVDSEPKQPTIHAGNGEGEAPLRAEETHKPNAEVQHNAQGRTNAGTEAAPAGSGTTDGGVSLPTVKKGKAVAQQRRTQHVDFATETEEQSKAFEESIPKMTDEELLGYIAQDSPDATKQYHPALGDEYDYRHRDEEQDYYNFYEPMLDEEYSKGGREAVEETYNKAWQDWVNGGYASAEDRTRLSAQINACEDWLSEHDKEDSLGATDTPEKVDAERQKVNTEPTEAQKEAGNYKKGHIKVDGYDISIENPKGSVREKKDANGKVLWRTPMHYDYGYIKNTEGTDGDHIDVYLSDNPTEGNVYVVDQVNQSDGSFDEHKVMYGFPSMEAARDAYKSQYEDGWKVGTITEVSREDFKKWVESSKRKTKPFSEYKSIEAATVSQLTQPDTTPTLKEPAVYKNNLAGGDAYANIEGNPKSGYVVRYYDNINDAKAKNPIAIGVENMTSEQLADHLQKGDFAPTEKSQEFADMLGTSPDKLREILNDTNKYNNYNTYGRLDEFKKGVDKEKEFALVDKIYGKQNKKYMYPILLGKMIREFLDSKGQTLPTKKEKGESNNDPLVKAAQETGRLVIGGVPEPTDSANEPKPIGNGDFGPIYNQFEGKPKEAFEFITKKKSGDLLNVFHRNDTGGIDLVWGDEKGGLNHIIVKHVGKGKDFETEADAFSKIEDVLKNGKLIQSGQLRYVVSEDGYRVAIRKDYNGNKKNWIVSAVDYNRSKEEKGITTNPTSASHGANGSELAAPGNSTGKDSNNNLNAQENGEKNDVVDKVIAESERRKALAKYATMKADELRKREPDELRTLERKELAQADTNEQLAKIAKGEKQEKLLKDAKVHRANGELAGRIRQEVKAEREQLMEHRSNERKAQLTKREAALRNGVNELMREAGIEVIDDEKEGQRVLDMANGARLSKDKKRALETASPNLNGTDHQTVIPSADGAKVLKNLDTLVNDFENLSNSPKFFIGSLARALGAQKHGSNSEYATFETKNGRVVTIRLANHNAKISTFDNHNESDGISIVITANNNAKLTNDGNAHVTEFYYNALKLRRAEGKPLADIVRSIKQALYSGEFKDTTGLAERQEVNVGEIARQQRVYHGSANDFDAFDTMNHLSEGEGNQAFGAGTYVADQKDLGMKYANIAYDNDHNKQIAHWNGERLIKRFPTVEDFLNNPKTQEAMAKNGKTEAELRAYYDKQQKNAEAPRILYTVEIPDDNGKNYLDWDGELSRNQADTIRKRLYEAVLALNDDYKGSEMYLAQDLSVIKEGGHIGDTYGTISDYLGSDKAASEFLHDLGYTGIKVHAAHNSNDARYKDNWNYVIFNDKDLKITDKVRFFRTTNGEAYGFTVGGKIYIDPRIATSETPIHEYAHLWAEALRKVNPKEWVNVVELMKGCKEVWEQVTKEYPELETDDEIAEEVLAHYSGKRGAERLRAEAAKAADGAKSDLEKDKVKSAFSRLKDAIKKAWKHIAEDILHIHFTTAEEVADKVMYDLLNKVNPNRFNLSKSVEEGKDLIAVHNLTEDKLKQSLELGGFPMPSIAITKSSMGHAEYGDISLLFGKDTINPSDSRNKVYSGDAWTPTFPHVSYKLDEKKLRDIYSRALKAGNLPFFDSARLHPENLKDRVDGNDSAKIIESGKKDYGMKQMFLSEKGNPVKGYVQKTVDKYSPERVELLQEILDKIGVEGLRNGKYEDELKQIVGSYRHVDLDSVKPFFAKLAMQNALRDAIDFAENGNKKVENDVEATQKEIDSRIAPKEYDQWLHDMLEGITEKKGIRNNTDPYTRSGDRLKWERLYDAVTLDNVLKAMKAQPAKSGGFFNSIFGASAKELSNLNEVREEAKRRIKSVPEEEFKAEKDKILSRLEKISLPSVERSNSISGAMDFVENVKDAVVHSHTPRGIYKYLSDIYPDMTIDVANEIADVVKDIQSMSTRYLEAKPYRAVGFDEVRAAVVPSDTEAKIVQQLKDKGIPVYTYEKGNAEERRQVVNDAAQEQSVKFHKAEFGNSKKAAENEVEAVNKRFNEELEKYKRGEVPIGTRFELGMPSKALESAGFPYLPISMRASLLSKKAGMERHPFEASDLRDLVKAMQMPIAIFKYSKDNMRNLIVDVKHGDKHFLVGITLDYKAGDIEVNSVSGLFPKESHEWIKWIQDGKAIRIDQKKKVLDLIDSLRTNPAESERIGLNLSSVAKIVEDFENPVIKGENLSFEDEDGSIKDVPTTPEETEESDVLYRIADDDEAAMLDKEPTVKVYRAMQLIDGKLYPPMMAGVKGKLVEPMPRRGSAAREHTEAEKQQMQRAAEEAGEALGGVKINVERNGHDGIKGSYNTEDDTVHVNLDEADDAEDIQATVSHEVLGHEGLKALFGSNKAVDAFGEFIYDNAGKALRKKIVERAAEEGYEWDDPLRYSKAAQEVFSDIASEGPANADEFSLWRKIKHYVIKAAKKLGLHIKGLVNDHDLRYYVLKTGKAVKTWAKMSDADKAEAAESGRIMYSRRGKPKQKKGESMAHYIQRLREYEMWKNAEQKAREANDPLPEREDFEKKAQEEFNKAMDDWRKQTGIEEGAEQPEAFPKRKDGETPQEYAIRVADYESELDKWKTAPNVFDYLKKGEDAYRQAYEDWKVRYDIQEMEDVDEKLYGEAKQEPSEPESEEEHYKKMEIDAAVDKDLGDAVGVDTGVDGARRQAKLAVIERRKNLESASAEDAIFIHDLCKDIDNLAKELGMPKERLRSDLITIIEEPRQQKEGDEEVERWVEVLNKMRAFQDAHTSITADGVKAARQELSDLAHEIHNHGYKPSTGEGRQAVHDAAVRLADKLNEFYKDNPSYNKLFGDDIMQVGKYIGYLDMAASMAEESSALGEDPRVKAIVDRIHDWYDNFFHVIEDAGLRGDAGYIAEGYINHIWDKDKSDAEAWNTYVENFQRTKSANMHHRTVDTYLDGIKVGLVPKFNDVAQIMSYYSRQNNEAIANKKFLDDMSFLTISETNKDGEVTRILPVLNSHKPNKFDEERYQMYHVPGVGDVWVLKDVASRFASIFGTMRTQDIPNWLSNIGKGYDLLGSTMKKIQLSISGFHAFALTEVAIAQMGPINGVRWAAKSLPIELKPLLMLKELFKGTLIDSIKNGTIPAYAHPEDFKFAASHLVQLGATQDYAAADVNMITEKFRDFVKGLRKDEAFMKKVAGNTLNPFAVALDWINKGMDKLLWNYLHDGLKIACFKHFAEQIDRRVEKEGLTAKQRERLLDEAGQYVNDTFGGQYWELLNVSPATLKWLRRAFLSPDWLISTQRHFFANFGFGSLYDPRTFAQYLSDQLPGGKKRKAKREQAQQGDDAEPYITKPEDDGDIYRQFRSKAARLCYILGVGVYFYTMMNGINAIMRVWDKEKEKEKADEIRKTNPEYKSPYELAYPDGMKWYDYTMFGNSLGQQTHLFLGRYADGSEMYVRWGKQFREFPEMFIGSKGLDFPAPMIQRLMGKANPVIGLLRDNLGALGIWGFENQNDIADIQAKYGKTIGLLAMNARHFFPYSLPTQADKEFKMMDVFMPSQKGFTRYKTVDYFKDFIKSGDMEGVARTYRAATMNGINAEDCLKAAITTLKAEQKDEMRDGIVDVTTACAAYDKAKTLTEKKAIRNKMIKLLAAGNYKAFTRAEALQMVNDYMNGNDVAEKDNDKYIQLSTSSDVRADYRLNAIGKQAKTYADSIKNAAKRGDSQTADRLAQRYGAWLEIDALAKQERSVVNKLKKQLGHGNDRAIMNKIRQARRDFQSQIDQVQPPK